MSTLSFEIFLVCQAIGNWFLFVLRCFSFFLQSILWYLFLLCSAILLNNCFFLGNIHLFKFFSVIFKTLFLFWRIHFFIFLSTSFKNLIFLCSIHRTVMLLFLCWFQVRIMVIVFIVDVSLFLHRFKCSYDVLSFFIWNCWWAK